MTPLCRLRSIPLASIAAFSATLALAPLGAPQALAQDAIYAPGELIVTGFPGVVPPEAPPDGADPLDYTFIDIEASSMQIVRPTSGDSPVGQLIASPQTFSANASDIGLVFGTTLDNAHEIEDALAPNIYLGATAAFGLHLVTPDADGNPVRTTTGGPDASYMPGQWGSAGGVEGYPGSIWKVDGETGEISLFTTIAANTGAGLGDIEYDPSTYQFFVSDLDTGLYAILSDGNLKGKSSILHVARWLLRGSPADGFQPDVKSWIRKASLQFALNETTYEVRLDEPDQGLGALLQCVDKAWSEVARFASPAEFKSAMSVFFLRELGLDALPTWNDSAIAMFFGTSSPISMDRSVAKAIARISDTEEIAASGSPRAASGPSSSLPTDGSMT